MSISHLSLVNQKLAYASSVITLLNTDDLAPKVGGRLRQAALVDAVVFHLVMALRFYFRELAEHHHIKNLSTIDSVQDLVAVLQQADKVSSESSELLALSQTSGTWLNQLTCYYDELCKSPEKPKEKKAFGYENRIELVELHEVDESPALQLTTGLLITWLDSFRALAVRQRETSAEF